VLVAAVLTVALVVPSSASALEAHFCGYLVPHYYTCNSGGGPHSYDEVRTRYAGGHNIYLCVYTYNIRTSRVRGDKYWCGYSGYNIPLGHYYGYTTEPDYYAYNWNLSGNAHTIWGWAYA